MTSREKFIEWVTIKMENETVDNEIEEFFENFKAEKVKTKITEKGRPILEFMREHKDEVDNMFTAKFIGESIDMSSRSVSGAIRKLITEGFVDKIKGDVALTYSITEAGEIVDLYS